jgi:hypothetical protein
VRAGEQQQPTQQTLDIGHHGTGVVAGGGHPVEIEAVGEELPFAGGDDGQRTRLPADLVQVAVEGIDGPAIEPVLAVAHRDDPDGPRTLDLDHVLRLSLRRCDATSVVRPTGDSYTFAPMAPPGWPRSGPR